MSIFQLALLQTVAYGVILGSVLALALHIAEDQFPIKPGFEILEVIAGSLLVITNVLIAVVLFPELSAAQTFLIMVTTFISIGFPVSIWQILKYHVFSSQKSLTNKNADFRRVRKIEIKK